MKIAALIPAAGSGSRLNKKIPKPFVLIFGQPLLVYTLRSLIKAFSFHEIVLAVDALQIRRVQAVLQKYRLKKVRVVLGGKTRPESVKKALEAVSADCDWALVHDVARPLVDGPLVRKTIKAAKKTGAALCAQSAAATVKRVDPSRMIVKGTEDRRQIFLAQTPQVFRKDLLLARYRALGPKAMKSTDCSALFDGSAVKVAIAQGSARNLKITTPDDLEIFKYYLREAGIGD